MDEQRPVGRRRFLAESLTIGGVIAASAAWAYVHRAAPPVPKENEHQRLQGLVAPPREAGDESPGDTGSPACAGSALPRPRPPRERSHMTTKGKVREGGPPEPDVLAHPNGQ